MAPPINISVHTDCLQYIAYRVKLYTYIDRSSEYFMDTYTKYGIVLYICTSIILSCKYTKFGARLQSRKCCTAQVTSRTSPEWLLDRWLYNWSHTFDWSWLYPIIVMPNGDVMCVQYRISSNLYCIHFKNSQPMKSFTPSSIIDKY